MDKALLRANLALVKRHAERGELHIEQQKQIIAILANSGADTALAKTLLQTFEESQNLHLSSMERLSNALESP